MDENFIIKVDCIEDFFVAFQAFHQVSKFCSDMFKGMYVCQHFATEGAHAEASGNFFVSKNGMRLPLKVTKY